MWHRSFFLYSALIAVPVLIVYRAISEIEKRHRDEIRPAKEGTLNDEIIM